MRYLSCFLVLVLISGCCCLPPPRHDEEIAHMEPEIMNERPSEALTFAVEHYAVELKYDKRLHLQHAYACVNEEGPMIKMEFITQQILELCEARQLLVDIVEGLLTKLNTDYIEPEFRPYPFTAGQLKIRILFESFYVFYNDPMYIGWVVLEDGMSYFYAANLLNEKLDQWDAYFEPYYKSRSIAMAQRVAEKEYRMKHQKPPSALGAEIYRPEAVQPFRR